VGRDGRLRKATILLILALVVVGATWTVFRWYTAPQRAQVGGLEAGQPAPVVTLTDAATGLPVRIPTELAGRPFLLLFFSQGCHACRQEVEGLKAHLTEFGERGFTAFVVTPGTRADLEYLAPTGFPVLLDPSGEAFSAYGVTFIPHTVFVDRAGLVHRTMTGWSVKESPGAVRETVTDLTGGGGGQ
jgi:peroxiredoxin